RARRRAGLHRRKEPPLRGRLGAGVRADADELDVQSAEPECEIDLRLRREFFRLIDRDWFAKRSHRLSAIAPIANSAKSLWPSPVVKPSQEVKGGHRPARDCRSTGGRPVQM